MRWRTLAAGAGVVALAGAGALGWLYAGDAAPAPIEAGDPTGTGAEVYAEHCAACHGDQGQGQPDWRTRKADGRLPAPPLNGSGHTWHHPDRQLVAVVSQGISAMAPEGYESDMRGFADDLTEREIRAVLGYIKTWWPDDARARQRRISERADAAQ